MAPAAEERSGRRHLRIARPGRREASRSAKAGDTVALGRLEKIQTGETLSTAKGGGTQLKPLGAAASRSMASPSRVKDRKDEVKLTGGARQADGGRPLAPARARPGHAPDGAVGPGRDASARGARAARSASTAWMPRSKPRQCPLQGDDPQERRRCAAGTRSSRAATASSATWCSTSSRCRAARASSSPRRSPAAWCRGSSSPRSRSACRTICSTGRSASRWSTWR